MSQKAGDSRMCDDVVAGAHQEPHHLSRIEALPPEGEKQQQWQKRQGWVSLSPLQPEANRLVTVDAVTAY